MCSLKRCRARMCQVNKPDAAPLDDAFDLIFRGPRVSLIWKLMVIPGRRLVKGFKNLWARRGPLSCGMGWGSTNDEGH